MNSILIAVCGLSPQIFTETLYALHREGQFPMRAILLTTRQGAVLAHEKLLGKDGKIAAFLHDYQLPASAYPLSEEDILVPQCGGTTVEDITCVEESEAFQELIMRKVWELTQDTSQRVDFSIAGGRKTMSASLALAAQCYGREQDRMFHVLADPHCETDARFFYPSPDEQSTVPIILAPVPFLRLRSHLPTRFLQQPCRPQILLSHFCNTSVSPLIIHIRQRHISLNGNFCTLPPALFSVFFWFALHKKTFPCDGHCPACHNQPCFTDTSGLLAEGRNIAALYAKVKATYKTNSSTGILDLNLENFLAYKAKLNQRLHQDLGTAAELAQIVSIGTRPNVRYGLLATQSNIQIQEC